MSTPTNEQRVETLRRCVAGVSRTTARGDAVSNVDVLVLATGALWALSRIEELAKENAANIARRDAWSEFAEHQEWCADCAESVTACDEGTRLRSEAHRLAGIASASSSGANTP